MMYLVDTNIVSEIMRPQPHDGVVKQWQQQHSQIMIAAITWHELLTGVYRLPHSKKRSAFEQFLFAHLALTIPILPYDEAAARWHAQERARLMKEGLTPSFADGQIAAIAAINDLTLVTRNLDDFTGFAELKLENWF